MCPLSFGLIFFRVKYLNIERMDLNNGETSEFCGFGQKQYFNANDSAF